MQSHIVSLPLEVKASIQRGSCEQERDFLPPFDNAYAD